jgi:IS30 family transposase
MKTHKQLTEGQRYLIAALKKAGKSNKEIVVIFETSESTISRQLKRNTGRRGYRPEQVSGWIKEQHGILLSHERIYQHIWADRRRRFIHPLASST